MVIKKESQSKRYVDLCTFLTEIDWKNVKTMDSAFLQKTLISEIVLFCTLKSMIRRSIRKSKIDKSLSNEISNLVMKRYDVRILDHLSINSFSDDKNTIYVCRGLVDLLEKDELISVILHEIGHGKEKLKLIYDKLLSERRTVLFKHLAPIIKKQLNADALNKTTIYMLANMVYISSGKPPFVGAYKWSYSDYAVKLGYWDQFELATKKIDRVAYKANQSALANKLVEEVQKNPESGPVIEKPMEKSLKEKDDSIFNNISVMLKELKMKVDRSKLFKMVKNIFR